MGVLFWTILSALILIWYIIVTVKVTFKGGKDVMDMITKLKSK